MYSGFHPETVFSIEYQKVLSRTSLMGTENCRRQAISRGSQGQSAHEQQFAI
jgi:hypothetical protein